MNRSEERCAIVYLLAHDPLAVIGFLLIGASGVLFGHVLLKLEAAEDKTYRQGLYLAMALWFSLPCGYLRHARLGHRSAWPLFLAWLCAGSGLVALVIGLLRLQMFP
jgi:hypothetical protein